MPCWAQKHTGTQLVHNGREYNIINLYWNCCLCNDIWKLLICSWEAASQDLGWILYPTILSCQMCPARRLRFLKKLMFYELNEVSGHPSKKKRKRRESTWKLFSAGMCWYRYDTLSFFLIGFVYVFFLEPTVEAQTSKGFLGLSRNMTVLIGGVGGAFLIILIGIIGVMCFVRKLHKRQTPASTPANSRPTSQQDQPELSSVSVTKRRCPQFFKLLSKPH